MILFGSTLSPFVRKTVAFATEKGLDFELKPRGIGDPDPDFCKASPFRKMPALQDGDYCLADSSAICHYIEAKHPDPALIPAEARARGQVVWFDEFADTILFGCGQKVFFNRVVAPRFLNRPGDESVAEAALRDELPPILDYLESVVPTEGGFLVGDRISLADMPYPVPSQTSAIWESKSTQANIHARGATSSRSSTAPASSLSWPRKLRSWSEQPRKL